MFTVQQFADSDQLPTLPEVALRLLEIAQQENPDFREVSQIIRSDPVVSGKILKTVNSSLFAFSPKIESIEQSIPKLGVTLLRTLVLSFHLSQHKTHQVELEVVLQRHWRSSLTQAVFAELIAEAIGIDKINPATCFLAATLQDIGILAMVCEAPEEYLFNVLQRADFPSTVARERKHFGFSHIDVSVAIVKKWGMEESFVDAIRHHHDRVVVVRKKRNSTAERFQNILQAASLGATVLASSKSSSVSLSASVDQWIEFLDIHFGFTEEQAEELISEVNQRVAQYSVMFNFAIGESVQTEQVVAQAKTLLQEIALNNQLKLIASESRNNRQSTVEGRREDDELYRDCLSGLRNRRYMNEYLTEKLTACIKKRKPIALMFLDVDKFKSINDRYGHSVGDRAIKHVADWLSNSVRHDDMAIRLGGDEFIVVLQSTTGKNVENVTQRIASQIPPLQVLGESHCMSLSAGCVFYQPQRGDVVDVNWLIEQADRAMYRAKKNGGDTVAIERVNGTEAMTV